MARKHYAKALISHNGVPFDEWMEVIRNQHEGAVPKDHVNRIAKTVLRKCDPKQYLLSHATIVASVDTYAPKGAKVGRTLNRGVQIDVKWPEFRIKPETASIINNNGDCWDRSLLLNSYRTFIGAQNYLEHVQIPELSKGFIVDAVARDLGSTCYIDILVATDRRHTQLVNDILSGDVNALSMGCVSMFTICTKCGNVAADEAQLCPCIQYDGKHTPFQDEDGSSHKIAELIGHVSVPNSNQFIEASWVKNPAFKGAVRRNLLNPDIEQLSAKLEHAKALSNKVVVPVGIQKAASGRFAAQDQGGDQGGSLLDSLDLGDDDQGQGAGSTEDTQQGGGQDQGASGASGSSDKIDGLLDKVQEQLLSIMVDRLGEKLQPKPEDVGTVVPAAKDLHQGNNNLVRGASDFSMKVSSIFSESPKIASWATDMYTKVHGGNDIRQMKVSSKDVLILSWIEDLINGRARPAALYKLALKVGPIAKYSDESEFRRVCTAAAGRFLTAKEHEFLNWKGRIASFASF